MKALITGFTGMVGSHLADYLLKNTNWKIYGEGRWRSPLIILFICQMRLIREKELNEIF